MANQITTSQTNVDSRAALSSVKQIQSPGTSRNEQANATRFDYTRKPKMVCDHCKKPGHLKKSCFDIVGYPPGWQPKQFNRFTSGGSNARRPDRAHLTLFGGERSAVTTQALEEFKGKLMANTSEGPAEATSDAHSGKGTKNCLTSWIIDSGATNHMTGSSKNFSSYTPCSGRDRVCIADGSLAPIMGYGNINCTPSLSLSPVLHVPNLPVDLLSVSSLTKSRNCKASFDPHSCTFQDPKTRRNLGTGIEHDGLYYLTNAPSPSPYALSMMNSLTTDEFLLMHYRLGHLSFQALSRMFPSQVKNCCKEKLLCDVRELAEHTRTNYPSSNERSKIPLDVVHSDVWGPSVVTALTGDRYYVTFIDGFSRCTWLYLLKHKSEVLPAFKDFF